jgi:hypothetical protein
MSEPLNREQRRHPEKLAKDDGIVPPERPQSAEHDIAKHGAQDDASARTKSTGHGKKTADKWNQ